MDDLEIWCMANVVPAATEAEGIDAGAFGAGGTANHVFRFTLEGKGLPEELVPKVQELKRRYDSSITPRPRPPRTTPTSSTSSGSRSSSRGSRRSPGPIEHCVERLHEVAEAGVTRIIVAQFVPDQLNFMRTFADEGAARLQLTSDERRRNSMTAGGFRILDVHHHVGDPVQALAMPGAEGARGAARSRPRAGRSGSRRWTATASTAAIADPGPQLPAARRSRRHPAHQRRHRRLSRQRRPTAFPAALGIVEPLYGRAGDAELRRIKEELGFVGVSFHTRFQGVTTDSPLVLAQIELMGELGLVPFLHSVAESPEETLWRIHGWPRLFPT